MPTLSQKKSNNKTKGSHSRDRRIIGLTVEPGRGIAETANTVTFKHFDWLLDWPPSSDSWKNQGGVTVTETMFDNEIELPVR